MNGKLTELIKTGVIKEFGKWMVTEDGEDITCRFIQGKSDYYCLYPLHLLIHFHLTSRHRWFHL